MSYANATHLAGVATGGWQELAERACPGPGVDADLMHAAATEGNTATWPNDLVQLAQLGALRINEVLDMSSRHADTYLFPRYRQHMPLPQALVDTSPLPDVVAALALRRLYGALVPEDIAKGTGWADQYLRDLSKGVVSLGAVDTVVAQPMGASRANTQPKAFDWGRY